MVSFLVLVCFRRTTRAFYGHSDLNPGQPQVRIYRMRLQRRPFDDLDVFVDVEAMPKKTRVQRRTPSVEKNYMRELKAGRALKKGHPCVFSKSQHSPAHIPFPVSFRWSLPSSITKFHRNTCDESHKHLFEGLPFHTDISRLLVRYAPSSCFCGVPNPSYK